MKFVIETNLARKPAWWLLDDGRWQWTAWRPEGIGVAVSGDWVTSEAAGRAAARRVQEQACTAIGP